MSAHEAHLVYEIGEFRLDATRRLLYSKASTVPLAVTPKAIDALLYFLEHRGELLDKERLLADLWPGLVVDENSLAQLISALRRSLGEVRGENHYLVTVPGRGYRFVADVVQVAGAPPMTATSAPIDAAESVPRRRHSPRLAVAVVSAFAAVAGVLAYRATDHASEALPRAFESAAPEAAPARPSNNVAVLAFESSSVDRSDEFVAVGIAESVQHRLAVVRELNVIAHTSSFTVRVRDQSIRRLGEELNVRYLVAGNVQRAGDRLRVTARLIDASTGAHVWSRKFDRGIGDIFAVEDEIAHSVADALQVRVSPQHPYAQFGTDAYLTFLQGRSLLASRTIADASRAIERFSHAIEVAPSFAAAYAALADAHRHLAYLHEDRADAADTMARAVDVAEPLVARALALDASLGEAYITRADIRAFKGDIHGADADYRRGLALSPSYGVGHEHYADFLGEQGREDEALTELDRARQIDPLTPRNHYYKGLLLLLSDRGGRISEAEALFLQSLQVAPNFHPALLRLAQIRWREGRYADAVKLGERALSIDPHAEWIRWFLVDFYLELDQVDAARSVLVDQPGAPHPSQWLSICSYLRNDDQAARLVRTHAGRSSGWFADLDLVAYALRDVARSGDDLAMARRELLTLRVSRGGHTQKQDATRVAVLAQVTDAIGDEREAERLASQVLEVPAALSTYDLAFQQAVSLMVMDRPDAALELLEQAFTRDQHKRWWYVYEREPAFASLRTDARFQTLVAQARANAASQRSLLDRMRERGEVRARPAPPATGSKVC